MTKRVFFRVEYDGAAYAGWQSQPNAPCIQDVLERVLSTIVRAPCRVTGAGRTDAGVHAAGQGAHADVPRATDLRRLEYAVNAVLPRDIALYALKEVPQDFHARFSATRRTYRYRMVERKTPLRRAGVWQVPYHLDWGAFGREAAGMLGTHDFSAFCAARHGSRTTMCTVVQASLASEGEVKVFTIAADRFLYHMVRSVVGTVADISRGKLSCGLKDILESRDRVRSGETAPACGLTLEWVDYENLL